MHIFIASESGRPLTGPARLAHLSINELKVNSSLGRK